MAQFYTDCPRCGVGKTTFDVRYANLVDEHNDLYELFSECRACGRGVLFEVGPSDQMFGLSLGGFFGNPGHIDGAIKINGHVRVLGSGAAKAPDHLPALIERVFQEGVICLDAGCYNAAATMFRLCVDLATRPMLPEQGDPPSRVRRSLGLRLEWLFENDRLPKALEDLSNAVKDDGNDGAHDGTLNSDDAADLLDFSAALLERLFTEPARLALRKERRDARRT